MANLGIQSPEPDFQDLRHSALRRAQLHRAQQMLVAAGLAALCVLLVAAALLASAA